MKKTPLIWLLGFGLQAALLLFCAQDYGPPVWAALAFSAFAFLSQFFLWRRQKGSPAFYQYPVAAVSGLYLAAQFALGLVFGLGAGRFLLKTVVFWNAAAAMLAWLTILCLIGARNAVMQAEQRLEQRSRSKK